MKIITYETIENAISPDWKRNIENILAQAGLTGIEFTPASEKLRTKLNNWNGEDDLLFLFAEHVGDTTHTRLFISSPNEHKYKKHCIDKVGHAKWGCCISYAIAVEYAPAECKLATQIHEALHLFGVDECYDEKTLKPISSCTESECLMRYGVQSTKVCPNVLSQLQSLQGQPV